jgi:hypothetical protein
MEACASGEEEAPVDAGVLEAAADTAPEASAGGAAGQGGAAGEAGAEQGGAAGTGGAAGKGGGGQSGAGGTGGTGEGGSAGEAPDGGTKCGDKWCFQMTCTPEAGLPNITMEGCCATGEVCGAIIAQVNCVTPEQAAGLGFNCHPK